MSFFVSIVPSYLYSHLIPGRLNQETVILIGSGSRFISARWSIKYLKRMTMRFIRATEAIQSKNEWMMNESRLNVKVSDPYSRSEALLSHGENEV